MASKVIRLMWVVGVVFFLVSLVSCSSPGNYFSPMNATQTVYSGSQAYTPNIIPINNQLYTTTKKFSQDHPQQAYWYQPSYAYRVGAGDVLFIIVWDHPELSTPVSSLQSSAAVTGSLTGAMSTGTLAANQNAAGTLVSPDGSIFFPYAGSLRVRGLTTEQIRKILTRRLSKYIRSPQVSVRVVSFRSKVVHVLGAVMRPGSAPLTDIPVNILDAITAVGGINQQSADTSHIFVVRGSGAHPQIFMLDAKSPSTLLLAENFKLYPNDIIYVPNAGITNWNHFISQILPTLTTVTYANSLLKK